MKKLILSLLLTLTLTLNVNSQCNANFTYSISPTNPLQVTFVADVNNFPVGSFNFEFEWYVFSTLTSTNNPAVITFSSSGTYKIKFYTKACLASPFGVPCSDDSTMFITVNDGLSTGIKDHLKNDNQLLVYPNPTSGIVNLKLTESDLEKKYSVVNMMGQIILVGEFKDLTEKIDLSVLSSGIYILTSEKKTVKIMKN